MGRPRLTAEQRLEKVPEATRLDLLVAKSNWERAKRELDNARASFREVAAHALAGDANIRDLGSILGMNHQTVQELVNPYKKTRSPA